MMEKDVSPGDVLKSLSTQDFLGFGVQNVAYVRQVKVDEKTAWSIHAADGTPLSVMDDLEVALALIRHNELEPVTVH